MASIWIRETFQKQGWEINFRKAETESQENEEAGNRRRKGYEQNVGVIFYFWDVTELARSRKVFSRKTDRK